MTTNQKLLTYFIEKHSKPTVTVLLKLCYLTDLVYFSKNKEQITDYNYIRYTFGPFDERIYDDLEELVKTDVLDYDVEHANFGDDTEIVVYCLKNPEMEIGLEAKHQAVADEILQALSGHGALQLTKVAYKTKPMVALKATLGGKENIGVKLDLSVGV